MADFTHDTKNAAVQVSLSAQEQCPLAFSASSQHFHRSNLESQSIDVFSELK
jgi:hypothetical protein